MSSESSMEMQEYARGVHLHRTLMKDMDPLARTMSAACLLQEYPQEPQVTVQVIFKRNGITAHADWEAGEHLPYLIRRLKQGKFNHIFDDSHVSFPPPRRRQVRVWKRPRERRYYLTRRERKGEGDVVIFVKCQDGVEVWRQRYTREPAKA